MKMLLTATIVITLAITAAACNLIPTDSTNPPGPTRFLLFKFTAIPDTMTDEAVIAQMHDTRANFLRNHSTAYAFPVTDSIGLPGAKVSINRIIVTPPGSGHTTGAARLLGGQDADIHPFQSGFPSSLLLNVSNGHEIGVTHYAGDWELQINHGTAPITASGNSTPPGFMEYTLDSFDATTTYATGRFAFIATSTDPTQRWAIFDGEFALTQGN